MIEQLLREHHQLLYHTAYGITGNRDDAEDVLHSLVITLLQKALSPELRRTPAPCLHRAVVDLSLTVVRARRRQKLAAGSRERDDCHGQLMTAIVRLKPRALEVLLLHYKHDYTDAQIAALLGTSSGTIAVTLSRLRARLKQVLRRAGCGREGATRESLRDVIDRHVPSPSHVETAASRDWILDQVRSIRPQLQQVRTEDGAGVVSWWRGIRRAIRTLVTTSTES